MAIEQLWAPGFPDFTLLFFFGWWWTRNWWTRRNFWVSVDVAHGFDWPGATFGLWLMVDPELMNPAAFLTGSSNRITLGPWFSRLYFTFFWLMVDPELMNPAQLLGFGWWWAQNWWTRRHSSLVMPIELLWAPGFPDFAFFFFRLMVDPELMNPAQLLGVGCDERVYFALCLSRFAQMLIALF